MRVRRLRAGESALFKLLRLRALADVRVRSPLRGNQRQAMVLAEEGSTAIGMAFGVLPRDRPGIPHLGGMWVDPGGARRSVGRALADAVFDWARERGFARIALWVTEGNRPAIALYEQMGFAATGRTNSPGVEPRAGCLRSNGR